MAAKRKKSQLGVVLRSMAKKAGLSVGKLGAAAGMKRTTINGMAFGNTASIQRDVALRVARAAKADPKLLQPFLAERVPHGARKRKAQRQEKRAEGIFLVTCPCCEGEGKINVRKV